MVQNVHGIINQEHLNRKNDYLFRISIKSLIRDDGGKVLVVKESGRTWWDLPGGGMDHEENIKDAIARELHEEVSFIDPKDLRDSENFTEQRVYEYSQLATKFLD